MPEEDKSNEFIYQEVEEFSNDPKFNFNKFLEGNKLQIAGLLIGITLIGFGVFLYRQGYFASGEKLEILETTAEAPSGQKLIIVEISGAVEKPGVYELVDDARVEDLLIAARGVSADADREWMEKFINRAAKLTDGQKVYISKVGESFGDAQDKQSGDASARNNEGFKVDQGVLGSGSDALININTASFSQLDSLPGIGQVYGQSIIEHRPYSNPDELVSKGALKQSVYEKIKELITVY